MENDWNKWLRERAYALWENDGRPDGKDSEHWARAEEELKRNSPSSVSPREGTNIQSNGSGTAGR